MNAAPAARLVMFAITGALLVAGGANCSMTGRPDGAGATGESPQQGRLALPAFPDSRPILVINGYGGHSDDRLGRRAAIRESPEALVAFVWNALEAGYRKGYRRFLLNQLAGHPHKQTAPGAWAASAQTYIPMHIWQGFDDRTAALLTSALRRWTAAHPDAVLMAYLGVKASRRGAFQMPDDEAILLDMSVDAHRRLVDSAVIPWREAGVRALLFDWAAAQPAHESYRGIKAYVESTHGMRVGGEAVPYAARGPDGAHDFDRALAADSAWLGTTKYMQSVRGASEWRMDPAKHEIIVGVERPTVTEAEMRDWWRRGATFAVYAGPPYEQMALRISREPRR